MKIFTKDPAKPRKVMAGYIDGDWFIKEVKRSKHYLRVVSGYAIQDDVVNQIKDKVANIRIKEVDTGSEFSVSMVDFLNASRPWTHGHGTQRVISERYLTKL